MFREGIPKCVDALSFTFSYLTVIGICALFILYLLMKESFKSLEKLQYESLYY